jgi:hypothetical protein
MPWRGMTIFQSGNLRPLLCKFWIILLKLIITITFSLSICGPYCVRWAWLFKVYVLKDSFSLAICGPYCVRWAWLFKVYVLKDSFSLAICGPYCVRRQR